MIAIGFDIGSSFVKAALVEVETGKPIARARVPEVEIPMEAQQLGWAEQHPNLWWQYLCEATQKLLTETDITAEQIYSIGISYQIHGLVMVERDLTPLRNSILW